MQFSLFNSLQEPFSFSFSFGKRRMESAEDPLLVKYLISSLEFNRFQYFEAKCEELSKELENLKLQQSQQTGTGEYVIVPPNEDTIETPVLKKVSDTSKPLIHYSSPLKKNDENDEFDEAALLHLVPCEYKQNASTLLEKLKDRGAELTWNSSGTVYLDQISIPNTNFFLIFPHLFQKTFPKKAINGLVEVRKKLLSMGLSKYFILDHFKELIPTEDSTPSLKALGSGAEEVSDNNQKELAEGFMDQTTLSEKSENWWFIGKKLIY